MEGKYYVRAKSSLNGKRVKAAPAFAKTMQFADLLAKGAKIASGLYGSLPVEKKISGLYRELTGKAMQLLKEGYKHEQVVDLLQESFAPKIIAKERQRTGFVPTVDSYSFAPAVIGNIRADAFEDEKIMTLCRRCYAPL